MRDTAASRQDADAVPDGNVEFCCADTALAALKLAVGEIVPMSITDAAALGDGNRAVAEVEIVPLSITDAAALGDGSRAVEDPVGLASTVSLRLTVDPALRDGASAEAELRGLANEELLRTVDEEALNDGSRAVGETAELEELKGLARAEGDSCVTVAVAEPLGLASADADEISALRSMKHDKYCAHTGGTPGGHTIGGADIVGAEDCDCVDEADVVPVDSPDAP